MIQEGRRIGEPRTELVDAKRAGPSRSCGRVMAGSGTGIGGRCLPGRAPAFVSMNANEVSPIGHRDPWRKRGDYDISHPMTRQLWAVITMFIQLQCGWQHCSYLMKYSIPWQRCKSFAKKGKAFDHILKSGAPHDGCVCQSAGKEFSATTAMQRCGVVLRQAQTLLSEVRAGRFAVETESIRIRSIKSSL